MSKADNFFEDKKIAEADFGVRSPGHTVARVMSNDHDDPKLLGTKRNLNSKHIQLTRIVAKEQVRKHFDQKELEELAQSLKTVGQQTPILVYWSDADDRYVIIAGERRFRAAQLAGIATLTCQIHPHKPTDAELVELQYVENAQRSGLSPIEEAESYKRLQELMGYSANQLAQRIGKDQTTVSRSLKLLTLSEELKSEIHNGKIPVSIAREIVKLESSEAQAQMAKEYLAGTITTGDARELTKKSGNASKTSAKVTKKWTEAGVAITVSYPRSHTLAEVAAALQRRVDALLADGRTKKAA